MAIRDVLSLIAVILSVSACAQDTDTQYAGHPEERRNMSLLGHHDLQGRPAYQPVIEQQGDQWVAYIGLMGGQAKNDVTGNVEWNGTLLIDVTDPSRPFTLSHIPGSNAEIGRGGSGAQMSRVCTMHRKTYLLRSYGSSGHEVWDVTVPRDPQLVVTVADDLTSVHKNWWECDTGIAYIVGNDKDWRSRHTRIYDLSDPQHPVFIRNYGIPGQEPGSNAQPIPTNLHGPIVLGNRVYFGYGSSRDGIIQIVDRDKLLNGRAEASVANLEIGIGDSG